MESQSPTELSPRKNDYEVVIQRLTSKICEGTQKAESLSSARICRVPQELRKLNESAYTPRHIAIGPLHRNDPHLQTHMQHVKMSYTNNLLCRMTQGMENQEAEKKKILQDCVVAMEKSIDDAKKCYAEDVALDAEMMLVDGCFILEFLYRCRLYNYYGFNSEGWPTADPIFQSVLTWTAVLHDLVLLENQIPFLVLKKLFPLTLARIRNKHPRLQNFSLTDYVSIGQFENLMRPLEGQSSNSTCGPEEDVSIRNDTSRSEEEVSTRIAGPEEEVSIRNDTSGPEEEVSVRNDTSGLEEEVSIHIVGPEEEVSTGNEAEVSTRNAGAEEEVSTRIAGPEEEVSIRNDTSGLEEEVSIHLARPEEEVSTRNAGAEEEVSIRIAGPEEEVSIRNAGPEEELSIRNDTFGLEEEVSIRNANYHHILHKLQDDFRPRDQTGEGELIRYMPSASELIDAGVKIVSAKEDSLFKVKFTKPTGPFCWFRRASLQIPALTIQDLTEPFFRNFIAFEQCCPGIPQHFTSYAILMDKLVNSDIDVQALKKARVLDNMLGASEDVTNLFNKLCKGIFVEGKFLYCDACDGATRYSNRFWPKNIADLRRQHCDSPWKFLALVTGFYFLVLNNLGLG